VAFSEIIEEGVDPQELLAEVTGTNYREIYDVLDDRYTVTVEKEAFVSAYDEHAETVYQEEASLMDGFGELVEDIRERGAAVALSSSSPPEWIQMVIDRFDLSGAFDAVVSAEEVEASKPDPAVYLRTAEELGVEPGACIAVEDSDNGIEAAKRAGMMCIGYRNESGAVDETAATPRELRETLLPLL
ncbi:MAG: HAD-IA family hydrolase, partial [Candidatus Nanohaloarchaea archaeon]|nr:HAD-IA family hydrolase [Candidatus Nanohaloarchaea archaeon]